MGILCPLPRPVEHMVAVYALAVTWFGVVIQFPCVAVCLCRLHLLTMTGASHGAVISLYLDIDLFISLQTYFIWETILGTWALSYSFFFNRRW